MYFGHLLFMLPAIVLAGLATLYTKTTFSRYSRYKSGSGMTGAEAARRMLAGRGGDSVTIEQVSGFLSDHYDPRTRTLRLSPGVYGSTSLSAIGVACHEAGHALQHAERYAPLALRSAMAPVTQFGSYGAYIFLLLGFFVQSLALVKFGIVLFTVGVVFSLVTLPVEWNASARAKALMTRVGIVSMQEQPMAAAVLNAAFLTYVAAAFTALMELLYWLLRSGLLGGRR